jgi:thiosulfate/3-mercaptopyruvate sulfurtransferase
MTYSTAIEPTAAAAHLDDRHWDFVDCTYVLGQPGAGHLAYLERHIPGAAYADLGTDLSGPVVSGRTGRHPLPTEDAFVTTASRLGITDRTQVIAYDASSGAMAAARLWWLLKWAGHDAVAVLDGGLAAWAEAGLPTEAGAAQAPSDGERPAFTGRFRPELVTQAADVLTAPRLVDSRTADRFRGENETVDPVAGHIPGAISLPFPGNVTPDGRLLPVEQLRQRFAELSGPAAETTFYCGSGVTAAHNVLAHARAGLGMPRLYPGSWSEWITDPARPVETGPESGT